MNELQRQQWAMQWQCKNELGIIGRVYSTQQTQQKLEHSSNLLVHKVQAPLNQYIYAVWVNNGEDNNFSDRTIQMECHATLNVSLVFNYSHASNFIISGQNTENLSNQYEHLILSGLKTQPFTMTVVGGDSRIGIILKPFCYGVLMELFASNQMDRLSDQLHYAILENKKADFQLAELYLQKLFTKYHSSSELIKFENYITERLLVKGVLKDFGSTINMTQKGFIEKFKRNYRITPNNYLKLKRVDTAIKILQKNNFNKLTEVALNAGFYDQSHFINIFKKFTGRTPKTFYNIQKPILSEQF